MGVGRLHADVATLGGRATGVEVEQPGAFAGVAHAIAVGIGLIGVGLREAVVAGIAHAIVIGVGLVGVGLREAVVAGIAHAVAISVGLIRVGDRRAVVDPITPIIAIPVRESFVRNAVAVVVQAVADLGRTARLACIG